MDKRLIELIAIILIFQVGGYAQYGISNPAIDLMEHAPSSPNAASLGKSFDYPVNMSTGVPSIEIPLFTIKSGNISLPITLKYHASGIRVDELASWVGMGWSLDAGGVVNRRVNGTDDFYPYVNDNLNSTYLNPDYTPYSDYFTSITDAIESPGLANYISTHPFEYERFIGRIPNSKIDGESDEYIYSTPVNGGKFFYNQQQSKFQLDKINGWKIVGTPDLNPNNAFQVGIGNWDILSNTGVQYSFGKIEKHFNPLILNPQSFPSTMAYVTYIADSWHLSQIIDHTANKTVTIYYDEMFDNTYGGFDLSKDYDLDTHTFRSENVQTNLRSGTNVYISYIQFDQGTVVFIKDAAIRLDGGVNALKEIQVKNNSNQIVKRYLFNYSYASADPTTNSYASVWGSGLLQNPNRVFQQLVLNSVQEISTDANSNIIQNPPYLFVYNFTHQLPCRFSFAQDYWGYYNGKKTNSTLLPSEEYNRYGLTGLGPGADRSIDPLYNQTGMLQEIHYPTGGKTLFEFENNSLGPGNLTGGLRIRKITNYDNVDINNNLVAEYTYVGGNQLFQPKGSYEYLWATGNFGEIASWYRALKISGQPVYPLFCSQGSPVLYSDVIQKQKSSGNNELISHHHFLDLGMLDNYQNSSGDFSGTPHNKYLYYDNFNGQENAVEIYKKNPDGSTSLVQQSSTDLEPVNNFQNYIWNVQGAWKEYITDRWVMWNGANPYSSGSNDPLVGEYPSLNAYKMLQDQAVVKQKQEITYNGQQSISTQTIYDYDVTNGNQKYSKIVNSEGDEIIKKIKFTSDYANYPGVWGDQIHNMIENNMVSIPIESMTFIRKKNTTDLLLTDAVLYQYDNLLLKRIYKIATTSPISNFTPSYNDVNGFHYDSHYYLFQEVLLRDNTNANPLTVSENSKKQSYIWDYGGSMTTAFIINADYPNVAQTSFEADGKGNWTFSGLPIANSTIVPPTGNKYYALTSGALTKAGLNSAKKYIVSYWSMDGVQSVSNIISTKTGVTIGGWTYYEHLINGTANCTISANGTGRIDEARLYPDNSQMSTYTYNPFVGITSTCDLENKITYYQYDVFNRLILVRDQENNILKKICYNYAGQPENCGINCTNVVPDWQNTATPLRCQVDDQGLNTGYQEQEQKDMNVCSPTYEHTMWVLAGQNTTACPLPVFVNLTSTNTYGTTGYVASYYNITTGHTYSFPVSTATGLQTLGTIPAGNYDLTISRPGMGNTNTIFKSGCGKQTITGYSATFYNITVTTTSCNSIVVKLDVEI